MRGKIYEISLAEEQMATDHPAGVQILYLVPNYICSRSSMVKLRPCNPVLPVRIRPGAPNFRNNFPKSIHTIYEGTYLQILLDRG